jgi:TolB protein
MSGRLNFIEMRYSHIRTKAISALLLISIAALTSCEKDFVCVTYHVDAEPPYFDPVWHPSGEIIGFNHRPIKSIRYNSDIPCGEPEYSYSGNSGGFYIINSDGTGKRRILPYFLQTPAWRPAGDYIAFVSGAQIFKMPFDGEKFDTTAIEQLTFEGRNFFPSWSPDGEWIAYDNTDCGKSNDPGMPPNSCGIFIMDKMGKEKRLVARGRMPGWVNNNQLIYRGLYSEIYSILFKDSVVTQLTTLNKADIYSTSNRHPQYSKKHQSIAFLSQDHQIGGIYLCFISMDDNYVERTIKSVSDFSWSPEGEIVYMNFDYTIDQEKGTLWIIDPETKLKRQLTYNDYEIFP